MAELGANLPPVTRTAALVLCALLLTAAAVAVLVAGPLTSKPAAALFPF